MTKKIILHALLMLATIGIQAQQDTARPFRAYLYNNEYNIYLRINLYDQDIAIPGQELYGQLPGFLGKLHNSFCWVITSCRIKSDKEAELQLINDFGSEDLTAILTVTNDSTYVLRHISGNSLRVPNKGKWQKLPKTLELKKRSKGLPLTSAYHRPPASSAFLTRRPAP